MRILARRIGLAVAVLGLVVGVGGRVYAEMVLTPAGIAQGFGLSSFATDFPNSGTNGLGPFGVAFPVSGGVLVSDFWDGTLSHFPTDTDNQSLFHK
jgi:hypothetical protein